MEPSDFIKSTIFLLVIVWSLQIAMSGNLQAMSIQIGSLVCLNIAEEINQNRPRRKVSR